MRRCQSLTRCTLVLSTMLPRAAAAAVHAGRRASRLHSVPQSHRALTCCAAQLARGERKSCRGSELLDHRGCTASESNVSTASVDALNCGDRPPVDMEVLLELNHLPYDFHRGVSVQ